MYQIQQLGYRFDGVRALVVGLAREGSALARFLAERGACVTITDTKPASILAESAASLDDLPVRFVFGGHPVALLDETDILFVSPGVPLDIPFLAEAWQRKVPVSSETRLFTRLCPAPIVGITGSSGKTTTTTIVGAMLAAAGRRTWVGGNIGKPLIGSLPEIDPSDAVTMELSSFQLELFGPWTGREPAVPASKEDSVLFDPEGWSPSIAAILNITPNHLDRHPTMEAYIAAKSHILLHQGPEDIAVLNWDNPVTQGIGNALPDSRQILWFSCQDVVSRGAFLQRGSLMLRLADQVATICQTTDLRLLGTHNVANVLAACVLAGAAGAPLEALRETARTVRGVEHRLQLVCERHGVRWYNDSIATTPERTVAALQAFPDNPIVLLAGGRDKHLTWEEMAALTWQKARHLVLFGEAAGLIEEAMQSVPSAVRGSCCIHDAGTLERAVEIAAQVAQPGDIVLLSPGGTSFDAYPDFAARGLHFQQLVETLG